MADALRDLVVSLSLDSDNFTRNIKSVNKQIQEAESYFKLASAGVKDYESTANGLSDKLGTLEQKLRLQQEVVQQYERALAQASDKLRECYERQEDYNQRLAAAQTELASASQSYQYIDEYVRAYETLRDAYGEDDGQTQQAKAEMEAVATEYLEAAANVEKLSGQCDALQRASQNAADGVSTAQTQLNKASAAVKETEAAIEDTNQALELAQTAWQSAQADIEAADKAIASIGSSMQLAESEFNLATSGLERTVSVTDKLRAKTEMLTKQVDLQRDAVGEYEKKLEAAEKQLEAAQDANDPEKIEEATEAVKNAQTELNNARAELQNMEAQLQVTSSAWTQAGEVLTEFGERLEESGQSAERAGKALTNAISKRVYAFAKDSVNASMEFESSFALVRKTVNGTEEDFDKLASASKRLSTEIATTTTDINKVMATGGQLGIATEHIEDFAKTMIDLSIASTDLDADTAATQLAKFANIMGTDQSMFSNMGSTIAMLGNNFATTEAPIAEMAMRIAGAGRQVGLTEAQVLGLATALSSVGIQAQAGGSSISKMLINMEVAAATGSDALNDFAAVCGLTAEEFVEQWESDPIAVFQKFITSLAGMSDEGISAIAVLQEMGIKEIRLRDTMLRAVNATELFANAQAMATVAWEENTALGEKAATRYRTTASQMANLKNKATLLYQTVGDDLTPTFQKMLGVLSSLADKLLGLDSAQRQQLLKWAAIVAAIGPVILIFGKVTKGIGMVTKAIGTFMTAVGAAGGGVSGLMSVLAASPAFWAALAVAVVAGTIALVDWASGAKAAREALKGLEDQAKSWKETMAETFYNKSEGLSLLGMSTDDFVQNAETSIKAAEDWKTGLVGVWTDGEKETDAIVKKWTDSWKALSGSTRDGLKELQTSAAERGYKDLSKQLEGDIKTLDAADKEIEALLKKRQNGFLTDAEKVRLTELVDTRNALMVKYKLVPDESSSAGFDTLREKVEAEVARATARGESVSNDFYQAAVVGAAEGMAAINKQLDDQYEEEYKIIQMIDDADERKKAQADLDERYNEDRLKAARDYADVLKDVVMPVWTSDEIQDTQKQVDSLGQFLTQYSTLSAEERKMKLPELEQLMAGFDEGTLTEYVGMLTQIQSLLDSGMSEEEVQALFPDIDFSKSLEELAAIQTFLKENKWDTNLKSVTEMFGDALGEEMITLTTDLDMTGAKARWEEWAANPGAITTDALIESYSDSPDVVFSVPTITAYVSAYQEIATGASTAGLSPTGLVAYVNAYAETADGASVTGLTPTNIVAMVSAYKELADGADISTLQPSGVTAYVMKYLDGAGVDTTGLSPDAVTAFVSAYQEIATGATKTALTPAGLIAYVTSYAETADGASVTGLTPTNIVAMVSAYNELADGADISTLQPGGVTAYINRYLERNGVDTSELSPNAITAFVSAYQEIATGASKTALAPSDVVAMVVSYAEAENIDITKLKPAGIEALVSIFAEATGCDKSKLLQNFTAYITSYQESPNVVKPTLGVKVGLTGYDLLAYQDFVRDNKVTVSGIVRLSDVFEDPNQALDDPKVHFWKDGVEIPATAVPQNSLTGSDFVVYEDDGTMHVFLKAELTGTPEAIEEMKEAVEDTGLTDLGAAVGIPSLAPLDLIDSAMGRIATANKQIESLEDTTKHWWERAVDGTLGSSAENILSLLDTSMQNDFSPEKVAQLSTYVGEIVTAIQNGEDVGEEDLANLQKILDFTNELDAMGIGQNVTAGIKEGLEATSWDSTATTVSDEITTAINTALGIASPAKTMIPVGENVGAGIGEGMVGYDYSGSAGAAGTAVKSALTLALSAASMRGIGVNAMAGLAAGIRSGQASVVAAIEAAARAAVLTAQQTLQIQSPSRVFRDKIGVMVMKGFGEGIVKETENQARTIANAARYLTDTAKDSAIAYGGTDNRKTYNYNSTVDLQGNSFYIRDEQDIQSLAVEIATLTRRQQRGKGLRAT